MENLASADVNLESQFFSDVFAALKIQSSARRRNDNDLEIGD